MEILLSLQKSKPGSWGFKTPNKHYIAADPRLKYSLADILGVLESWGVDVTPPFLFSPFVPQLFKHLEYGPSSLSMDLVLSI